MANDLGGLSSYDINKLLADPWTMPEVKTACQLFLNKTDYVSSAIITRDFVEAFDRFKGIKIIF